METNRELRWGIGALVALQVITSFGAIGLLGRMSPAIAEILNENVYTIEAAEEMLAAVALERGDAAGSEHFRSALERAQANVTEEGESAILDRIVARMNDALAGEEPAVEALVTDLRQLVRVNRDAMRLTDDSARRLGRAGAWAAVLLALVSFAMSAVIIRRITRRVIAPLTTLHDTLDAIHRGDPFRRCFAPGAGLEMRRILDVVNQLLDRAGPAPRTSDGSG